MAARPVIVITGPTGAGKSALALALAQQLPVELVSVDSAQVYRGMDIGTAKPTAAERAAVPHHLLDLREPEEVYSAGEFRRDCLAAVRDIHDRGGVPVLVGGTMLYLRALFHGLAELPPADPMLRRDIDARAAREGWPAVHAQLAALDAAAAARIHPHDAQRIQRALEVALSGPAPLSELWRRQQQAATQDLLDWRVLAVVLEPAERSELHAQLALRLDAMIQQGFTDEVRALQARGTLSADSPAMRAVGYRQLWEHCIGQSPLSVARDKALFATRQLAKRQLTWLRSDSVFAPSAQVLKYSVPAARSIEPILPALLQHCRPTG